MKYKGKEITYLQCLAGLFTVITADNTINVPWNDAPKAWVDLYIKTKHTVLIDRSEILTDEDKYFGVK